MEFKSNYIATKETRQVSAGTKVESAEEIVRSEKSAFLPMMSNANVLKRANQIEKESNFIGDCWKVVNMSGTFSSRGPMGVGGK